MRSDAYIKVTCDTCKDNPEEIEIQLTAIARGGYDERDVDRELQRYGWTKDGDKDICDVCGDEEGDR